MTEHVCNLRDPWPIGHPLPEENPFLLQGPELGPVLYHRPPTRIGRGYPTVWEVTEHEPQLAEVIQRSYVWSPGECRHGGGYRHYDWSVIRTADESGREYTVVVNDTDLTPLTRREYLRMRMESGEADPSEMREWDESEADRREALEARIQPGTWEVMFLYDDEYYIEDAQRQAWMTRAEAEAFADGLEWGDEPKFKVVSIRRIA